MRNMAESGRHEYRLGYNATVGRAHAIVARSPFPSGQDVQRCRVTISTIVSPAASDCASGSAKL